jgi:hypothetical protein
VSDLQSGAYKVFTPATVPGVYTIALYTTVDRCDYRAHAADVIVGRTPSVKNPKAVET